MQVQPRYCNICNIKIPASDFESGEALQYENYYYCAKCKEKALKIIQAWQDTEKKDDSSTQRSGRKSLSTRTRFPRSSTRRSGVSRPERRSAIRKPTGRTPSKPDSGSVKRIDISKPKSEKAPPTQADIDTTFVPPPTVEKPDSKKAPAAEAPKKPAPQAPPDAGKKPSDKIKPPSEKKPPVKPVSERRKIEIAGKDKPAAGKPSSRKIEIAKDDDVPDLVLDDAKPAAKKPPSGKQPVAKKDVMDSDPVKKLEKGTQMRSRRFSDLASALKKQQKKKDSVKISDKDKANILKEMGIKSEKLKPVSSDAMTEIMDTAEVKRQKDLLEKKKTPSSKKTAAQTRSGKISAARKKSAVIKKKPSSEMGEALTEPMMDAVKVGGPKKTSVRRAPSKFQPTKKKSRAPILIVLVLLIAAAGGGYYYFVYLPQQKSKTGTGSSASGETTSTSTSTDRTGTATSTDQTGTAGTGTGTAPPVDDKWKETLAAVETRIEGIPDDPATYKPICEEIDNLSSTAAAHELSAERVPQVEELKKRADRTYADAAEKDADGVVEKAENLIGRGEFAEAVKTVFESDSFFKDEDVWKKKTEAVGGKAKKLDALARKFDANRHRFNGPYGRDVEKLKGLAAELDEYKELPESTPPGADARSFATRIKAAIDKVTREDALWAKAKSEAKEFADKRQFLTAAGTLEKYAKNNKDSRFAPEALRTALEYRTKFVSSWDEWFRSKKDWAGNGWTISDGELSGEAGGGDIIAYKGKKDWDAYELTFKLKVESGNVIIAFGFDGKTGYEFEIPSGLSRSGGYDDFKFKFEKGKLTVTSSLTGGDELPMVVHLDRKKGMLGFKLLDGGKAHIKDIHLKRIVR